MLGHEVSEVSQQLEQQVFRIREELRQTLLQLQTAVEHLAANADSMPPDDPATLARTTLVERTAQRLAKFKTSAAPTFGDSVRLLRQLGKATRKLRRP